MAFRKDTTVKTPRGVSFFYDAADEQSLRVSF